MLARVSVGRRKTLVFGTERPLSESAWPALLRSSGLAFDGLLKLPSMVTPHPSEVLTTVRSLAARKCSPPWLLMFVALVSLSSLHLGALETSLSRRRPRSRRRGRPYHARIVWASVRGFIAELVLCLWAIVRTRGDGGDEEEIAFYCGFGKIPGERDRWDGGSLAEGIGGSEQCVIRLARALRGKVVVYNNCGRGREIDGVTYRPTKDFNPWATYGHVVVWRLPQFLLAQRIVGILRRKETTFTAGSLTYWVHDGSNLEMLRRGGPVLRCVVASAVRLATRIVFPSPEARRDQYHSLFPVQNGRDVWDRACTIRHGVPRYFSGDSDADRRRAWLVWPVSVERGLDTVLRHLDKLEAAANGDFRLFVCHHERGYHGDDGILENHRSDPRVIVCGMLSPSKLAAVYRRCSLFVFPSSVPEAFSLSAWECMTHGVLPVAYGLGALESLPDCGAVITPPGNEAMLIAEASALLADPLRLEERRNTMRDRVRHCDWPDVASEWRRRIFQDPGIHHHHHREKKSFSFDDDDPVFFSEEEPWIRNLLRANDLPSSSSSMLL